MIVENDYLEDIQRIWKENNSGYISYESNQQAITDKNMKQLVWRENEITMAYAILYFGKDFCELEKFPNQIGSIPEKMLYIWEIVTDKKYSGRGIANKLMEYITSKYSDFTMYSCIDLTNIASLKLHEKNGFKPLYKFETEKEGIKKEHYMMCRSSE